MAETKKYTLQNLNLQPVVIKNYFTTAFRSFSKNKLYTFINVLGLTVGITASFLMLLYVDREKSYDQFHVHKEQLYRVELTRYNQGELTADRAAACAGIGPSLKENFPEVKAYTKLSTTGALFRYEDVVLDVEKVMLASEDFFTMFSFPLVQGVDSLALSRINTVVLSETIAQSIFKEADPIGKLINFRGVLDLEVTGVYKDFPEHTHMDMNALISFETYSSRAGEVATTSWKWDGYHTYILLEEGTDPKEFESKLPQFVLQQEGEWLAETNQKMEFHLRPLTDIHLHSHHKDELKANGDAKIVEYLLLIAIFIIAIAWINYVNLATAKSLERAKEVGVRKALGSNRAQLMWQFLVEAFTINVVAILISLLFVLLLLPYFSLLVDSHFDSSFLLRKEFWFLVTSIIVLGTLCAGLYPAFFLSRFNPIAVLKGKFKNSTQGIILRKGLVMIQFAVAVVMIIGTFGVYRQLQFMRNQPLGFSIDQVLVVRKPLIKDLDFGSKLETFKGELLKIKDVNSVTAISELPGEPIRWSANEIKRLGAEQTETSEFQVFSIDSGYVSVFDLQLAGGRNFKGIEERGHAVIINKKAARLLGFRNESEVVNQSIVFWDDTVSVIGVLEDYYHETLKTEGSPIVFPISNNQTEINYFAIKLGTANAEGSIQEIGNTFQTIFEGNPFAYFFLDERYNNQYKQDIQFGKVAGIFSTLAIILTCMGLFGLSSYTASLRIQEIGIRKVMGASVASLIVIMGKEYMLLSLLGMVVGVPVVWFGLSTWLTTFATRMEIEPTLFIIPCLGILLLTIFVISYQTVKAALTNPVYTLRSE